MESFSLFARAALAKLVGEHNPSSESLACSYDDEFFDILSVLLLKDSLLVCSDFYSTSTSGLFIGITLLIGGSSLITLNGPHSGS